MSHKKGAFTLALIAALALVSGSAFAQAGRGVGRLGGVVVDMDEKPLEGAKVKVVFSANEKLVLEAVANKKGEWSIIGLGTGSWNMTATFPGYDPVSQPLTVSQLSVNPKVTIKMKKTDKPGGGIIADETAFVFLEQGNQLFRDLKYDEAIVQYQLFLEKNPLAYQVQVSIADCYREKGDFDKAHEIYDKIILQAKTDVNLGKDMAAKALAGKGSISVKQGKFEEAQDYFKQSIESSPKDEVLAYNVGEINFSNQRHDEALKFFEMASQIKPDWPDPYLKMGYVYLNKADNAAAIAKFEKFLTLEPEGERAALARNILNAIKK